MLIWHDYTRFEVGGLAISADGSKRLHSTHLRPKWVSVQMLWILRIVLVYTCPCGGTFYELVKTIPVSISFSMLFSIGHSVIGEYPYRTPI